MLGSVEEVLRAHREAVGPVQRLLGTTVVVVLLARRRIWPVGFDEYVFCLMPTDGGAPNKYSHATEGAGVEEMGDAEEGGG